MPEKIVIPNNAKKILLHACCAPCSGSIIERLRANGVECTLFFYNPNIHPEEEYQLRLAEQKALAEKTGAAFVAGEYDPQNWFARTKGLENEPERGQRCSACFAMRLERAARFAEEKGFSVFASTLGISRWKDLEQVNTCGLAAAAGYADLIYWTYNWRKQGGSQRMSQIAKEHKLYRQNYCGCVYSKRASEGKQHG